MRVAAALVIALVLPIAAVTETAAGDWYEKAMAQVAKLEPVAVEGLATPDWDIERALETGVSPLSAGLPESVRAHWKSPGDFRRGFLEAEQSGDAARMRELLADYLRANEASWEAGHSGFYVTGLRPVYQLLLTENTAERLTICREPIETYLNDDRIRVVWARGLPALLTHMRLDAETVARGEMPGEWAEIVPWGESAEDLERMIADDPAGMYESIATAYSTGFEQTLQSLHTCPTEWWGSERTEEFTPWPAELMVGLIEHEIRVMWEERTRAYVLRKAAALASGEDGTRDACFDRMASVRLTDDGVAISMVEMPLVDEHRHPLRMFELFLKHPVEPVELDDAAAQEMLEELRKRREEYRAGQQQ